MKRGTTHLEVVISTILFILAVTLLLFYLNPVQTSSISENAINGIDNSFQKEVQTNITKIFVSSKGEGAETCLEVDLNSFNLNSGYKSYVTDLKGDKVNSKFDGRILKIEKAEAFNILLSPEVDNDDSGVCEESKSYSIGSSQNFKIISEKKLIEMRDSYNSNYQALKDRMNIPGYLDFSVTISESAYSMEQQLPERAEIQAKSYNKQVLYKNGTVSELNFIIKTW